MFRALFAAVVTAGALLAGAVPAHAVTGNGGAVQWAAGPTAVAQPTPQIPNDQIVRVLLYHNGVMFAGGRFDRVRNLDGTWVARKNLAAFDARTGALLPWAPRPWAPTRPAGAYPDVTCNVDWGRRTQTCDTVYAMAVLGGRLYVAGDFWSMTGPVRDTDPARRVAAFTVSTGKLDTGFQAPSFQRSVRALAARPGVLYAGGYFQTAGGKPREHLASLNANTGGLYDWAPAVDGPVWGAAYAAGKVAVGGPFDTVAGVRTRALGAVDGSRPVAARFDYKGLPDRAQVTAVITDGTDFYVASEGQGPGVFDGQLAVNATTGALRWRNDCRGATQALALRWPNTRPDNHLFWASHTHDCSQIGAFGEQRGWTNRYFRAMSQPTHPAGNRPVLDYWCPDLDGGDYSLPSDRVPSRQGPLAVAATPWGVWYGGQQQHVNGVVQRGLVRFGYAPAARSYPPGRPPAPTVTAVPAGARIAWLPPEDIDTAYPRYSVQRSGIIHGTPVWQTLWSGPVDSRFWTRKVGWVTHAMAPRALYRVVVSDGTTTLAGPATLYPGN